MEGAAHGFAPARFERYGAAYFSDQTQNVPPTMRSVFSNDQLTTYGRRCNARLDSYHSENGERYRRFGAVSGSVLRVALNSGTQPLLVKRNA